MYNLFNGSYDKVVKGLTKVADNLDAVLKIALIVRFSGEGCGSKLQCILSKSCSANIAFSDAKSLFIVQRFRFKMTTT